MASSEGPHGGRQIREPPPPPPEPRIEGLVLHGVVAPRAVSLGPEVRRALLQMFQERGVPPGAVPGMAVTLAHGLRAGPREAAAELAARVAEAVYQAMAGTPAPSPAPDAPGAAPAPDRDPSPFTLPPRERPR